MRMNKDEEEEYPVWRMEKEDDEDLPGGPKGCIPEVTVEEQLEEFQEIFDLDTILEENPELFKLSREEAQKKFRYERQPLIWNTHPTGKEIISRGDEFLSVATPKYVIVPNEWIASGVEQAVERLGLTLLEDRSDSKKLFRYYLDTENPLGPNNELQAGFFVRNSVDGSMSFEISAFAYRLICMNGMTTRIQFKGMVLPHMRSLELLDMPELMEMIAHSIMNAQDDCRIMEEWDVPWRDLPQGPLAVDMLRTSRLPNKMKPLYLQKPHSRLKIDVIPQIPEDNTFWMIYNDITSLISKAEITERTRVEYQNVLHKTLRPLLRA
jgi:hypothetical protein